MRALSRSSRREASRFRMVAMYSRRARSESSIQGMVRPITTIGDLPHAEIQDAREQDQQHAADAARDAVEEDIDEGLDAVAQLPGSGM